MKLKWRWRCYKGDGSDPADWNPKNRDASYYGSIQASWVGYDWFQSIEINYSVYSRNWWGTADGICSAHVTGKTPRQVRKKLIDKSKAEIARKVEQYRKFSKALG
jgi:hypothetical protein